jgi:hypothetical protein
MAIELYAQADRWAGYRITVGSYQGYVPGAVLSTSAGVEAGTVGSPLVISGSVTPTGGATETTLAAMSAKLPAAVGPQTDAASLSAVPSASQNPIFDHANGTKTSVTTSATIITPPVSSCASAPTSISS